MSQTPIPALSKKSEPFSWELKHNTKNEETLCSEHVTVDTYITDQIITLGIRWIDDIIDTKVITPNNRRWKDPEGKMRDLDLMYLYDGLAVRLFFKDLFYEGWVRPLDHTNWVVQWESSGSMQTRTSESVQIIHCIANKEDFMIIISLNELGWTTIPADSVKITLIAPDADTPSIESIKDRVANLSYCTASHTFIIQD